MAFEAAPLSNEDTDVKTGVEQKTRARERAEEALGDTDQIIKETRAFFENVNSGKITDPNQIEDAVGELLRSDSELNNAKDNLYKGLMDHYRNSTSRPSTNRDYVAPDKMIDYIHNDKEIDTEETRLMKEKYLLLESLSKEVLELRNQNKV